jgi:hypothetical protein
MMEQFELSNLRMIRGLIYDVLWGIFTIDILQTVPGILIRTIETSCSYLSESLDDLV